MCTASWCVTRTGYDLFFNRDELNSREPELPPAKQIHRGVNYVAPRDGNLGGTWLQANEHGVTVCLLNDYGASWRPAPDGPYHSRGSIVSETADARDLQAVSDRLGARSLSYTGPFHLIAFRAGEPPLMLHWDGQALTRRHDAINPPMFTSSSFDTAGVIAARMAAYRRLVPPGRSPSSEELRNFHLQHDPSAGAQSVLMRRPDAATRSLIHIEVQGDRIRCAYSRLDWSAMSRGATPLEPTQRIQLETI